MSADEGALPPARRAFPLSLGPCTPNEAGISLDMVAACARARAGHCSASASAIRRSEARESPFGGAGDPRAAAPRMARPASSIMTAPGCSPRAPSPFTATRYHSLIVAAEDSPAGLIANAHSGRRHHPSGFRHESLPIHGVQFHPESIATEHGHQMLAHFPSTWPAIAGTRCQAGHDRDRAAAARTPLSPLEFVTAPTAFEDNAGRRRDPRRARRRCPRHHGRARRDLGRKIAAAAAQALRERMVEIKAPPPAPSTCAAPVATGRTALNISTAVAIVVAACGVPVAKDENRAASPGRGAADTIEALGLDPRPRPSANAGEEPSKISASASSSRRSIIPRLGRLAGVRGAHRAADHLQPCSARPASPARG